MPRFIVSLHFAAEDGVSVWARKVTDDRRASTLASLAEIGEADPALFADLAAWVMRPFRHRVQLEDGRRPHAMRLRGAQLSAFVGALRRRVRELGENSPTRTVETEADVSALIDDLLADGSPVMLSERVIADGSSVAVLAADSVARTIVDARQVIPEVGAAEYGGTAAWRIAPGGWAGSSAPAGVAKALCGALVDAHARVAFDAARAGRASSGALVGPDELASLDPLGAAVLDALGAGAPGLDVQPHRRRQLQALMERYGDSALTGVVLHDRAPQLVVRVRADAPVPDGPTEDPLGSHQRWLVEVCLREASGTVHPLAELVQAEDVTVAAAMQAMVRVRSHAPILSATGSGGQGYAWMMSTEGVSALLSGDALALEAAGIDVLVPREWAKKRVRVTADVEASPPAKQERREGTGIRQTMGSFRFRVSIGDVELSEEEAEAILAEQAELVKLRGEWVKVDSSTLKAAESFLQAMAKAEGISPDPDQRRAIVHSQLSRQTTQRLDHPGSADELSGPIPTHAQVSHDQFLAIMRAPELAGLDLEIAVMTAAERAKMRREGSPTGLEALFGAEVDLPALPAPAGLKATLRPYQKRGLDWLSFLDATGQGGILADDMGLGKTMQVLALLVREREDPQGLGWGTRIGGPTLLVCPMSVLGSWQREAQKFAPGLRVHVHHGPDRLHGDAFRDTVHDSDLVLTTYALVARDAADLGSLLFHRVILDEAQHIKNANTQVAKAVRALPEGRRLALTGTPVENDLTDLHSIMQVTNPGLLPPSESGFTKQFATPISEGADEVQAQLTRIIQPYVLRRVKTDASIISDLPRKREERTFVNITPEQAGLYQGLVDDMNDQLEQLKEDRGRDASGQDMQRRAVVSSTLMKLKQVLGHPAHFLQDGSPILVDGEHRSGKLERVDDLLDAIVAGNEKALIFTQFTNFAPAMIDHWERRFGIDVPFLHGGVSKADRDRMVHRFQNSPGEPGAMLLSLRAGGTGITLTAANHVIHLDRWWNPAVENQATDRAFRIGQRRNVFVHKLISIGTVEEAIDQTLADKHQLAQSTIRSGEGWLADLSDATLRSMFELRKSGGGGSEWQ